MMLIDDLWSSVPGRVHPDIKEFMLEPQAGARRIAKMMLEPLTAMRIGQMSVAQRADAAYIAAQAAAACRAVVCAGGLPATLDRERSLLARTRQLAYSVRPSVHDPATKAKTGQRGSGHGDGQPSEEKGASPRLSRRLFQVEQAEVDRVDHAPCLIG